MTQLGEITEPKIDQTGPPPVGEFTYVDISSVDNIGKRIVEPKRLPAESAPSRARQQLRSGDVLVSMTRPNLNAVALVPAELDGAVGSTGFLVLRARNNVLPHWLYYGVQTRQFVGAMSELVQGALYPAVRPKDIRAFDLPAPALDEQRRIVAEIEKQFSRLDKAVANLKRVLINARNCERATIRALTAPGSFEPKIGGTVSDIAISLDNLREPVNKTERAKRIGTIPYLGANGQTGWIDEARFDEELVLVVEDETFVGRKLPFSYYFSGKCWVNNHTHVLRARAGVVVPKYLNYALSFYPFIPLTTGSTGRRKLTKAALMTAPIEVPDLTTQNRIAAELDRRQSLVREVEADVNANLERAEMLRQAVLGQAIYRGAA